MSQQSQSDYSHMSHLPHRKSLELVALECARRRRSSMSQHSDFSQPSQAALERVRRRRSSMSQQSDFSQTTQQLQRECMELAALEKATRNNSLDLLGDVAALASSNSSISAGHGPIHNVEGVGGIMKNITASGSPTKTSLDLLSDASISLSVKNARDNDILAQSLIGLSSTRQQRFHFEQDEANKLFDDTLPAAATFPKLGVDQCAPFGVLQPTRGKGAQQQMQPTSQQEMKQPGQPQMKQPAQYQFKQRAQQQIQQQAQQQIQQQAQQQMLQQARQQMQEQAQQERKQHAQRQMQQQAEQDRKKQAEQKMKQQVEEHMQRQQVRHQMQQVEQERKEQAEQQMQQQAEQKMKQQVQEHMQQQAQQQIKQQAQQQMQEQGQNNALSIQAIQRNINNPTKLFDELNHQSDSANYNRPLQSASFLYGSQKNESGNCKATSTMSKTMAPPKESLTAQRLPIPQSPQALKDSEPLLQDFSKSIQNSQKSQKNIQSWDKKMGLKRSHSATMTKTTQSRNQIKKFLENLAAPFVESDAMKIGRSSKKKRKSDVVYLSGGL